MAGRERRGTLRLYRQDMVSDETPIGRVRRSTLRLASGGAKKGFTAMELAQMMEDPDALQKVSAPSATKAVRGPRMQWDTERGKGDMIKIDELTVQALVENLKERYDAERYYTYCGSILVALNPYYALHGTYYTPSIIAQYKNKHLGDEPPHLFAVADSAYREMISKRKSVSMIISGESGAGKTETTKLILNYLSALNNQPTAIEAKLIESASLLEAFGNAKTVRNKNSSRFGKYIKILFDSSFRICGAEIETYLLEKSRVTVQTDNERNYHIFYQLCAGASPQQCKKYHLKDAHDFAITRECTDIGNDEEQEFRDTCDALTLFGFSPEEQDFVFRLCAAFLHLGNLEFQARGQGVVVKDQAAVGIIAQLLAVPGPALNKVLTTRKLRLPGQVIDKPLNQGEAVNTRDNLSRQLYGKMFDWLVRRVSAGLRPKGGANDVFLGVLDIFGFENFSTNSFEQLCINYANEKLHQQFIEHVFKLEQKEYQAEGIEWSSVGCEDNDPCIQLIESRMGILSVLDEESRLQTGTDATFLSKCHQNFAQHKFYTKPRLNHQELFEVKHYAESVTYTSSNFREKNQNVMSQEVLDAIQKSKLRPMQALFAVPAGATKPQPPKRGGGGGGGGRATGRSKAQTVGSVFKSQLVNLKNTLDQTSPFYIRCIKPNLKQKDHLFDAATVGKQLAYSGMVETVKIRSLGYPVRYDFGEFVGRYKSLMPHMKPGASASEVQGWLASQKQIPPDQVQVGRSKVFLRSDAADVLERMREKALRKHVIMIQKHWRAYTTRKAFDDIMWAADVIQTNWRIVRHNMRLRNQVKFSLAITNHLERERRAAEERRRREEQRRREAEERQRQLEAQKAAARSKAERKRLDEAAAAAERQAAADAAREEKAAAAARSTGTPVAPPRSKRATFMMGSRKGTVASEPPAKPASSPMSAAKRQELQQAEAVFQKQKAAMEQQAASGAGDPTAEREVRRKIAEIDALPIPDDPNEMVTLAKGLQRKVRGQKPEVADKLYSRAVELYKAVLKQYATQDNFINCGTAMINWGNLRLIMPQHRIKEEACVPLLNLAHQMLEKAISMGLDPEGMEAVQMRLSKIENLKAIAVKEDLKQFTAEQRDKMIEDLSLKLAQVQPLSKIGKLQKQGGGTGTLGRKSWKKRIFVLSDRYVRYYAKSTNERPKGEIPLADVTGVKQFPVPGKSNCFAVTSETRFYPMVANDATDMMEWIKAIQANVNRLRLEQKLENFRAAASF